MIWQALAHELALLERLVEGIPIRWEQIEIQLPSGERIVILAGSAPAQSDEVSG